MRYEKFKGFGLLEVQQVQYLIPFKSATVISVTLVSSPPFNVSSSKNPEIKTPLVLSFSLGVVINFSPLTAL